MYTTFFNLTCKPFQLTPDPEFLFMSKGHKKALNYLTYGISDSNTGFILVTGEVGTGKTTLLRQLINEVRGEEVKFARIDNTKVTSEQLMAMINEDFGLDAKGKNKTQLLSELTDFLIQEFGRGKRPMMIIDEAQNLSPDMLEEVRLLSNLETDKAKLLQILLVGQPELRKTLALPELRQLRQRITISCHLLPLTREETEAYIFHRLEVAGNRQALSFDEGVIERIHAFSKGTPRLINIICDFIMLSAFIEKTTTVSTSLVQELIGQIESENRYWQDTPSPAHAPGSPDAAHEILHRLDRLEVVLYKWESLKAEQKQILEKLSEKEKQLNDRIDACRAELLHLNANTGGNRLDSIFQEIEMLKERIDGLENKEPRISQGNGRKRNWWERVFGREAGISMRVF
ncbi:MAG: XrtA/PEP-CTERM system-associated ATPase [Nitrospirota bacterium]